MSDILGKALDMLKWLVILVVFTMMAAVFGFETVFSNWIKAEEPAVAEKICDATEEVPWYLPWQDGCKTDTE